MRVEVEFFNFDDLLIGFHFMNYDAANCDTGEFVESGTMLSIGFIIGTINIYF